MTFRYSLPIHGDTVAIGATWEIHLDAHALLAFGISEQRQPHIYPKSPLYSYWSLMNSVGDTEGDTRAPFRTVVLNLPNAEIIEHSSSWCGDP